MIRRLGRADYFRPPEMQYRAVPGSALALTLSMCDWFEGLTPLGGGDV